MDTAISLTVDGSQHRLTVDTRTSLLDALRERLGNTSPKKGCDHGQCGACTVLVGGRRVLACLILAATVDGAEVLTADGLADGAKADLTWLNNLITRRVPLSDATDAFTGDGTDVKVAITLTEGATDDH